MGVKLTLLEVIRLDWHAAGKKGWPSREYVAAWREANPEYDAPDLACCYYSRSTSWVRGPTRLDRATRAWMDAGNGPPITEAFQTFLASYRDIYDEYE